MNWLLTAMVLTASQTDSRALADSLLAHGFYSPAAGEYERAAFLLGPADVARLDTVRFRQGVALALGGDLVRAATCLHSISPESPYLQADAALRLAGAWHRLGKDDYAWMELTRVPAQARESGGPGRLDFASAWLDLRRLSIGAAAKGFDRAGRPDLGLAVRSIARAPGRRSPTTAALMSALVPGLGQVYSGRPGPGLMTFLTVAASAAGTVWAARSDDWVMAAAVFGACLVRFYDGAIRNAARDAEELNSVLLRRQVEDICQRDAAEPDWFSGDTLP